MISYFSALRSYGLFYGRSRRREFWMFNLVNIVITPRTQVVMLTTFGEDVYVARALRAGVAGFLLKDTP
jgi:uncharacterized membrane protein YhaH (DUF805 family)